MNSRQDFIPPYPPRNSGPVPAWRGFFGERARTAVYGWSEAAFRLPYMRRNLERFTEAAKRGRHRFKYLPFGGGPRLCVGARFATVEALTILSHWLRGWSFRPMRGRSIRMSGMVTLRPAGGLPLILEQRI